MLLIISLLLISLMLLLLAKRSSRSLSLRVRALSSLLIRSVTAAEPMLLVASKYVKIER